MSLEKYRQAKQVLADAKAHLALIGKTTRNSTLATREGEGATAGRLHSLAVQTVMHFQPSDGAQNYHESKYFDAAFARVVRKNWSALSAQAIALLEQDVRDNAAAAKAALYAQIGEIDALEDQA